MTRLIEADTLKDDILKSAVMIDDRGIQTGYEIAIELIKRQPTVDAEPIRHGKWIIDDEGYVRCSVCGQKNPYMNVDVCELTEYCGWCGARMDEE